MDIKPGSPYDINGACFNADLYVKKVLKVNKFKKTIFFFFKPFLKRIFYLMSYNACIKCISENILLN